MKMKIAILVSLALSVAAQTVAPGDKDAATLRVLQLRLVTAQVKLERILQDPAIARIRVEIQAAEEALQKEQAKHPSCVLSDDNVWTCK